jgi:hypothetical protein
MESCMQKRWKYERNGKVIILRDICDRIMKRVGRFKQIGDIAIQYDPGHAALPWALFRFLLQVCSPTPRRKISLGTYLSLDTLHRRQ